MNAPRGRLGSYSLWQLRDYMLSPGIATILISAIVLIPMFVTRGLVAREGASPDEMHRAFATMFDQLVALLATVGPMVGIAGFASADRQPGLARFLFAKPVAVRAYYLQAWIVRGLALGAITVAVALLVDQLFTPASWLDTVAAVGMAWLLLAGMGFLLSVLVPRDIAVIFAAYIIPVLFAGMVKGGVKWWWLKPVLTVLPPTHKLEGIRHALLGPGNVDTGDAWHVALYGAACLVLAAYLVRRLPLVR